MDDQNGSTMHRNKDLKQGLKPRPIAVAWTFSSSTRGDVTGRGEKGWLDEREAEKKGGQKKESR